MTVQKAIARLSSLNVHEKVIDTLTEARPSFIAMNKNQLLKGIKASGEEIKPPYSTKTAKKKGRKTPNLYDKGDFQGAIFADVRDNSVIIDSADNKASMLIKKYGEDILGITKESKVELSKELRRTFFFNVKKHLYK